MSARERRRLIQDVILVSPQLFLFVMLVFVPLFMALPVLFTDRRSYTDVDVEYIGFDNFTRVFWDDAIAEEYWPALRRTARFTLYNYLMVYVFGLTLALLMYEIGFHSGLFTMIYMPQMLSGLALGFVALMLFSSATGVVNLMLENLGWTGDPINIKTERGTTMLLPVLVGWRAAGFNLAIFLSGLLTIPKENIEAAVVDGASYLQRLWWIYFPQMVPSFMIATIFCLLGSFQVFDVLVALGGMEANRDAEFLSVVIQRYGFSAQRLALGLVLSIETFVPLTLLAFLLLRLQRRFSYER
jgi:ABC-type sugar transport system permease subunit